MSVRRKRTGASPGHRTPEEREKTAERAIKILGNKEAIKGEIVGELYHLEIACAARRRALQRSSKQAMRAIRTFSAAVRRANRPHGGLPEDLRLLLGLDLMLYHLEVYEKFLGAEADVVLEEVSKVGRDGERISAPRPRVIPKPRRPRPDAYEKRLAAEAALRLCERYGVGPTTTARGQFCRLAALLYGDERAGLQHHCREALNGLRKSGT